MGKLRDGCMVLGCLALAGTIALLSPGVRAVRADDAPASSERAADAGGPSCEAGGVSGRAEVLEYLQSIQRLQHERLAASPEAAPDAEGFVVLNKRGYNDGPAPISFPSADDLDAD